MRSLASFLSTPLFLALLVVISFTGCVQQAEVVAPPEQSANLFEPGKTKSIAFGKAVAKISPGTTLGERKVGVPCILNAGKTAWNGADADRLADAFRQTLVSRNLATVGASGNLFEDNSGEAEILVGCIIQSVTLNVYHDNFFENLTIGQSNATVSVEWQVYDSFNRQTVLKKTTNGAANTTFENSDLGKGFYAAFENALQHLLASDDFIKIVVKDSASAPGSAMVASGADRVKNYGYITAKGDSKPLAAVQKSVVTVIVGTGHGSGFVVNNGLVITNQHVVGSSGKAVIMTSDNDKYEGVVVAKDAQRDVAAISVPDLPLSPLKIRKNPATVGMDIYAIGSPNNISLAGTVTKGIVSHLDRIMRNQSWIQGDATINHGNSGGPIVDGAGNVVGISTLGLRDTQGIYFYAPIIDALNTLGLQGR